jgi:hypothetical protein
MSKRTRAQLLPIRKRMNGELLKVKMEVVSPNSMPSLLDDTKIIIDAVVEELVF